VSRPDRLQRGLDLLKRYEDAVLVGSVAEGTDDDGKRAHPPNHWRLIKSSPLAAFAHSSIMFRRSAFDRAGGYRTGADLWEDLDLYWRMAREGRVLVISDVLTDYRYSATSVRYRSNAEAAERAFEHMLQAVDRVARGSDEDPLSLKLPPNRRVRPRVFVGRSWLPLWTGQRNRLFRRMLRNADLRLNRESLLALAFVGWGATSPRSLRFLLAAATHLRNRYVRWRLAGADHVEWRPHGPA
jgi:hypothetical protein